MQPEASVAELTGMNTRQGWPANQRLIARRTRPAARQRAKLPSQSWTVNRGWVLAANLAADIDAGPGSRACTTNPTWSTLNQTCCATASGILPAKLTHHARRRWLNQPDLALRDAFTTKSPIKDQTTLTNRG